MIQLDLQLDQPHLPIGDDAVRHLVARIVPPPPDPGRTQPPLDLAIVIDASGSMAGPPIAAAKEATLRLAREMSASTRMTIVSFAEDVIVHADAAPLDERGREEILRNVLEIEPRGSTNLHAGWSTACTLLGTDRDAAGDRRRHVVVLSDGQANQGVCDPSQLAVEAARQNELGVATTCVGVGERYSPLQLAAMADHGGGECHDAEDAVEVVEILTGSVLGLSEIAAENVRLVVDVPEGVRASELSGMPAAFDGTRLSVSVGALRAGIRRTVVVRLDVPAGAGSPMAHDAVELTARVRWREPGERGSVEGPIAGTRGVRQRSGGPPPSLADARAVLIAWQASLVWRATSLNRDGDFGALERLWGEQFGPFQAYAEQHPDLDEFLRSMIAMRRSSAGVLCERTRKTTSDTARQLARMKASYHSRGRGELREQLEG